MHWGEEYKIESGSRSSESEQLCSRWVCSVRTSWKQYICSAVEIKVQWRSKSSGDQSPVEIKVQWRSKCLKQTTGQTMTQTDAHNKMNVLYHAVPSGLQKSYQQELEISNCQGTYR